MASASLLPLLAALALAAPILRAQAAPPAGGTSAVTIYRCIAANGALTLRDSPCLKGERQEVRTMARPRDPVLPPAPAAPAAAPPAREPPPATRVVYRTPPRPMYECVTPEGQRYTSDNGDGNPRWVPAWTVAYPLRPQASVSGQFSIGNGSLSFHSGDPRPPPHPPGGPHRPYGVVLPAGGTWVRDECQPLPREEVCARLSDRRYEILRVYGSVLPSERRRLDLEQRDIDARLANDCTP